MSVDSMLFELKKWINEDTNTYPKDCIIKKGAYCFVDDSSYYDKLTTDKKGKLLAIDHNFHASGLASKFLGKQVAIVSLDLSEGTRIVYIDLGNVEIISGG